VSGSLLTTRAVAEVLGLSPETVLRRFRAGELPGYRLASNVLRFRADDIDAYLEARREGNGAHEMREAGRPTSEKPLADENDNGNLTVST
jgi:excisionase family DNA binding protein